MLPNRIRVSKGTTDLLKQIKAKTGITPNILARFALAQSIEDAGSSPVAPQDTTGSEFNIGTLLGDLQPHFEALLKQLHGEITDGECGQLLAGHIERGAQRLRRIKSPSDLLDLF